MKFKKDVPKTKKGEQGKNQNGKQGYCFRESQFVALFYFRSQCLFFVANRPIRLTQCCTQFKSPGVKIHCVLYLHHNVAFSFKCMEIPETKSSIPKGFELGTTLSQPNRSIPYGLFLVLTILENLSCFKISHPSYISDYIACIHALYSCEPSSKPLDIIITFRFFFF